MEAVPIPPSYPEVWNLVFIDGYRLYQNNPHTERWCHKVARVKPTMTSVLEPSG